MSTNTDILYNAAVTETANGQIDIACGYAETLAIYVLVNTYTGGTSPTATFTVKFKGPDGNYYQPGTPPNSGALAAAGTWFTSVGPGCAQAHSLGSSIAVAWTLAGTPTNVNFTLMVVGKRS